MQELYAAINTVKDPSLIRVESDEVTYPMHIIIRYEIERDMLTGDLEVEDVPKAWNRKMKQYLGCTPKDDKEVCAAVFCGFAPALLWRNGRRLA